MSDSLDVLFVCQHGAAKSVVAARHFAELARARGLAVSTTAAGIEPDEVVPPHVIAGLEGDGLAHPGTPPQAVTREMLENADLVVSFGCDLSALAGDSARIIQLTGVPHVSDGYDAARTEIVDRLHALLGSLPNAAPRRSPGVPQP